jgi:hypothetical protein
MKLTQRRIEDLGCPAGKKDALVFDDEQRGLAACRTALILADDRVDCRGLDVGGSPIDLFGRFD